MISGGRKRQGGLEKMKDPPAIRRRPSVQPGPFHSRARREIKARKSAGKRTSLKIDKV